MSVAAQQLVPLEMLSNPISIMEKQDVCAGRAAAQPFEALL
jgi:hypothetical protein